MKTLMQPNFEISALQLNDFYSAIRHEWLETNGVGGWASSSVVGAHTRRYHGLLIASLHPPENRLVLVSRLDEAIVTSQNERFELGCSQFPGKIHPEGQRLQTCFSLDPFPTFEYKVAGLTLRKSIICISGENTTLIRYEALSGSPKSEFRFELRPFIAARSIHQLGHANSHLSPEVVFNNSRLELNPYAGVPTFYIQVPHSRFQAGGSWYYNFEYLADAERGYDHREDLHCPGFFHLSLKPGDSFIVTLTTESFPNRDGSKLLEAEIARRHALTAHLPRKDAVLSHLCRASDQFIVRTIDNESSIMAGYHWFAEWGRDSMIALPGLCLVTGRFAEARSILKRFLGALSEGMLPNRFLEESSKPEYNTVDATLWFFVAAYKYVLYTADMDFLRQKILPAMLDIIAWHTRGTRFDIKVADDGLLSAGNPSVQLTWMDAKIGSWVVTPRHGKAVEINALWFNALSILGDLLERAGDRIQAGNFNERAQSVRQRFNEVFWSEKDQYLYDCITDSKPDTCLRPNQLLALSLPFPLMSEQRAKKILQAVTDHLLTPNGLRTLDPRHPNYKSVYSGAHVTRDAAYHQGTVWPWLLGPYISALVRYEGNAGQAKAAKIIDSASNLLGQACLGSIPEICDGAAPHTPRGAVAQAWSVAELLRAYAEDILELNTKSPASGLVGNKSLSI